jgi:WD40 repeat protein
MKSIASMALSSDSSTLYTLCRDHTVYAYSTSHLLLGSAPEMSPSAPVFKGERHGHRSGMGPLYGFRDPNMAATTFYLKLSVRKATDTQPELLAVGSSDNFAILFPADPRYQTQTARHLPPPLPPSAYTGRSRLRLTRTDSQSTGLPLSSQRRAKDDDIPIYYTGTPLVAGHRNEVTGVTWAQGGNLVTISDDLAARCWREDEETARSFRAMREDDPEKYGVGWSAVRQPGWDDEI